MAGRTPEEAISKIADICDFSNLPKNHPMHSDERKSTIGYFKDELAMAKVIQECSLVRSKCYSLKLSDWPDKGEAGDIEVINRCKGVRRNIVRSIPYEAYRSVLTGMRAQSGEQHAIRSSNHTLYTVRERKTFFSSFDDKVYLRSVEHKSILW